VIEVSFHDQVVGAVLLAFDGRVVERFVPRHNSSYRIHSTHVNVRVHQPDRRGNRRVEFSYDDGSRGGFDALTDGTGYATLHPLLRALEEAGVPFVA
jgi:hypothetical protein